MMKVRMEMMKKGTKKIKIIITTGIVLFINEDLYEDADGDEDVEDYEYVEVDEHFEVDEDDDDDDVDYHQQLAHLYGGLQLPRLVTGRLGGSSSSAVAPQFPS